MPAPAPAPEVLVLVLEAPDSKKLAEELYKFAKKHGFVENRLFNEQEDPSELMTNLFGSEIFHTESITFKGMLLTFAAAGS